MAVAVRHEELRQRLAYGGDEDIGAVRLDAGDQLVVGRLQIGKQLARLAKIELQLPVEGSIDGIRPGEGLGKSLRVISPPSCVSKLPGIYPTPNQP